MSVWNICGVPFPTGEPFVDAIESKRENSTDDGAEVSKKRDEHNARGNLVRTVPVAHMEKHTRPKTCFEET